MWALVIAPGLLGEAQTFFFNRVKLSKSYTPLEKSERNLSDLWFIKKKKNQEKGYQAVLDIFVCLVFTIGQSYDLP